MIRIPYAPPEDSEEELSEESRSVELCKKSAQWLAGSWKLDPFNEKAAPSERKAEWRKFRNQFERICDCKVQVDSWTKLKGMKIHSGEFLLNIIEMKEAETIAAGPVDDIYNATLKRVNEYFDATCDRTQERIKFCQMKQDDKETFTDWVLRLEMQAKFCEFDVEQRKEEFLQALITSSVSMLAEKLFEAASFFKNDIPRMIQHDNT